MVTPSTKSPDKAPSLRRVVHQQFLKSAAVPLGILITLMLVAYFFGVYYTHQTSLSEMRERAKSTVDEITRSEASSLNHKLSEVSRNTTYLQTVSEKLFKESKLRDTDHTIKLQQADTGVAYRDLGTIMDGSTIYGSSLPSSLYVAAGTTLNKSLRQRLQITEALDPHFQRIVDGNPTVSSTYFNSWDNSSRFYPPLEDVPRTYTVDMDVNSFNFYYLANGIHNPKREPVWTGAYLDPAGYGWILSSIAPVYNYGFLEGVIGVDITLSDFASSLLSNSMIWNSTPLVVQDSGEVLSISEAGQQLLNLWLPAAVYGQTKLTMDKKLPAQYNLFRHPMFSKADMHDFVSGDENSACCTWLNGEEYLLSQQVIAETGWRLIVLTPISEVTQQITKHQHFLNKLGVYFFLLTAVFFTALFVYLKIQARNLADRVSNPVALVTDYISRLNKLGSNKPLPVMQVGIRELDRLISTGTEIQLARSRLSLLNEELEQKNNQLQTLATTDRLTGLYNRHILDEMLARELNKAKRDNTSLSLALLDVDHFKQVNDTYGHQIGDHVLVNVATILKNSVRHTDLIGRWGGEEFMILLPNTNLDKAASVLDELREQIAGSDFPPVPVLTVSLGLAGSQTNPSVESIVAAADKALYKAKDMGRNRLETAYGLTTESDIERAF